MPSKKKATTSSDDMDDGEYRKKRERNNLAVKLCRIKSSKKAVETKERVDKLKTENERLEEKIDMLKKNVEYLKGLLLTQLPSTDINKIDLEKLLADSDADDEDSQQAR